MKVGTAYVSIRARLDKLDSDLKSAKNMVVHGAKKIDSAVKTIFSGLAGYFVVSSMKQFGQQLFETGRNVARLEKAFSEIAGSTADANKEFEFLRKTSDDLGQNFYDLADAYKGFLAASKGTELQGKATRDIFVAITRAGASLGLSSENMRGALYAVQQMMSKGKVTAEELRQQLGERLPGAFNLLAEAMGVSAAELDKMLQNGQVMAVDALPKLAAVLRGRYSGAVDEATRASNEFAESWIDVKAAMAQSGFLDSASKALSSVAVTLKDPNVQQGLKDFAKNLGLVVEGMANLAKYAGLRSITGTFDTAVELSKQGLLDLTEFARLSFTERQKLVDDILAKQQQLKNAFKIGPATPGYPVNEGLAMVPPVPAAMSATPDKKDWGVFYNDDLANQQDRLSKALEEIQTNVDDYYQLWDDLRAQDISDAMAYDDALIQGHADTMEALKGKSAEASEFMRTAFAGWAASFSGMLTDLVFDADTSFGDILESFARMITQMAIQKQIVEPLFNAMFTTAGVKHAGGIVGNGGPTRQVPSSLFAFAPRLHNGLAPDEFPAILQRGERVIPKGGGSAGVIVNNYIENNSNTRVTTQTKKTANGVDIKTIISEAVAEEMGRFGSPANKTLRQMGGSTPLVMR